jgi:hypothetical protein
MYRMTPHNWHNFLRCHEQAAEWRHPVAMASSKPLRDERGPPIRGPPILGPVSPKSGPSQRRRPTDAKRSWARSGPPHVLRRVVAQDGQAHRVVTDRRRPVRLTSGVVWSVWACATASWSARSAAEDDEPEQPATTLLMPRFALVDLGKGLAGDGDTEELAQRWPAVGDVEDQQPVGRDRGPHLGEVPFEEPLGLA